MKRFVTQPILESVYLAQERGAFPVFDWQKEKNNSYIKRLPKNLSEKIETFGRRNISILTNAPTGSVSIMSQTSSGLSLYSETLMCAGASCRTMSKTSKQIILTNLEISG